jgi:hypothetical protein
MTINIDRFMVFIRFLVSHTRSSLKTFLHFNNHLPQVLTIQLQLWSVVTKWSLFIPLYHKKRFIYGFTMPILIHPLIQNTKSILILSMKYISCTNSLLFSFPVNAPWYNRTVIYLMIEMHLLNHRF